MKSYFAYAHSAIVLTDKRIAGTCSLCFYCLPTDRWSNLNQNYRKLLLYYVKTRFASTILVNTIDLLNNAPKKFFISKLIFISQNF